MMNMINNGNYTPTKGNIIYGKIPADKSWFEKSGENWEDFKHLLKK